MRKIILVSLIALCACNSSKKSTLPIDVAVKQMDVPECIKTLIVTYKKEQKQNPPRSIYSYTYNGKTVYYVPAICCDQYSNLLDGDCNIMSHPDGGITGKGDGKLPDFKTARTNEKLIWTDDRE